MSISTQSKVAFELSKVISIYKQEMTNSIYTEISNVTNGKLSGFRSLNINQIKELKKIFHNQDPIIYTYQMDPDILSYRCNSSFVEIEFLTRPQQFFHIYALSTKIESGLRPAPMLKWEYSYNYGNEELNIMACVKYKGDKTEWYNAPFMNTSNGDVCLGGTEFNTEILFSNINALKKAIIDGFFSSAFTHIGKPCSKTNFIKLQQNLLNGKLFPNDELIRC